MKRLFEILKDKVPEMHEIYWKKISYWEPRVVNGELIEKFELKYKYAFQVKELAEKYKLTEHELRFLINYHPDYKKHCQFCSGILIVSRNGEHFDCGHSKKCAKDDCTNGAKYTYCYKHEQERNQLWEQNHEIEMQNRRIAESQLFCEDLLPDMSYVLCHEVVDEVISWKMSKIRLSDIGSINDADAEHCFFNVEAKIYFTWLTKAQLTKYIDLYI